MILLPFTLLLLTFMLLWSQLPQPETNLALLYLGVLYFGGLL